MKRLTYAEACTELRRTGALYEADKITIDEWCASVHRILEAAGYAVTALAPARRSQPV